MAQITGQTTTTILGTAGVSADQFGAALAVEAANRSVMQPLVRRYIIPGGNNLYLPKVGTRSVTSRTRGTDDTDTVTFTALNDSKATFTKKAYTDAIAASWLTMNDLTPAQISAWLDAERSQMAAAFANQLDADVIGAIYDGCTTNTLGSGATDFSYALFVEAVALLRQSNAPEPYFAVLPETQWDHIASTDELTRYDARGEGDTMQNRQMFRAHGVNIFTTGNVPTSLGSAKGIVFSGEVLALTIRDFVNVTDYEDEDRLTSKVVAFSDYAYALTFEKYACQFQTTDA